MDTSPPVQFSSAYNTTPFEMMHNVRNTSSDDQETSDDDTPRGAKVFVFPHFSIQTETSLSGDEADSPVQQSIVSHTQRSQADSSESDIEATHLSPDFPKFRPGLLSEHGPVKDQNDTTSPDFPKVRPGLLSQQISDGHNSSPDFPKFRPGLLTQHNSDATSPDFPKFRPGLLSKPMSKPDPIQNKAADTNISPDFPKFRPGLLNGNSPSPPSTFRLSSPPYGTTHPRSSSPLSPPGYNASHLKSPLSPLARTSAAQSRFPHIRSILKPPTGAPFITHQQQNRTTVTMSPLTLRKKVLQHNTDLLLTKKGTIDTTSQVKETGSDSLSATDQDVRYRSPPVIPSLMCTAATPPLNQTHLQRENSASVSPQLNPVPECPEWVITSQPGNTTTAPSSPPTPPKERSGRTSATQPHVHFAGASKEELRHVVPTGQVSVQGESSDDREVKDTSPRLSMPPNQVDIPSKMTTPSPLSQSHQETQKSSSTTPTSHPTVSRYYSRRKSVTFQQQPVRTSPLGFHHSRKSPLSPTSSRYYKRRRSTTSISHKQHHKLTPSPHLPTHIYRKVSLSPVYLKQHKQSSGLTHQGSSPHLPSLVYGNIPAPPLYYKRRKSVSVVTHHDKDHDGSSPVNPRHYKRRKSLSVLTHHGGEPYRRHQKRRRSVSISTEHDSECTRKSLVDMKHHKRRESLSTLTEHEGSHCSISPTNSSYHDHHSIPKSRRQKGELENLSSIPANSRYYERRKSDSALVHRETEYLKPPSLHSKYYKRRKSATTIGQHQHDRNHLVPPIPPLPVHVHRNVSMSSTHTSRLQKHRGSVSQSEYYPQPKSPSPILPQSVPMSPMNYKRQYRTPSRNRQLATPLRSPGHFLRKHLLSPLSIGRRNRRKSVLVINRENRLIPLTSPIVNRISLSAYQRSLPTTPLPRRYTRRKSLSSVITPRPRRRVANDEQIQVTMEAARFDVTSIYSAKSFLSLAPHAVANAKPVVKQQLLPKEEDVSSAVT